MANNSEREVEEITPLWPCQARANSFFGLHRGICCGSLFLRAKPCFGLYATF